MSDLFYLKFTHASIFLQWYSFAERTANISENMVLLAKKLIYPKLSNYTDLYKMKFLRLSVFLVPKLLNRLGNCSRHPRRVPAPNALRSCCLCTRTPGAQRDPSVRAGGHKHFQEKMLPGVSSRAAHLVLLPPERPLRAADAALMRSVERGDARLLPQRRLQRVPFVVWSADSVRSHDRHGPQSGRTQQGTSARVSHAGGNAQETNRHSAVPFALHVGATGARSRPGQG